MIVERFCGNRKIIESDSVYLYNPNDELVLCFMFREKDFDVKIRFEYDFLKIPVGMCLYVSGEELDIKTKTDVKGEMIGTPNPVKIAEVEGMALYMHVWLHVICDGVAKVEYTVYSVDL